MICSRNLQYEKHERVGCNKKEKNPKKEDQKDRKEMHSCTYGLYWIDNKMRNMWNSVHNSNTNLQRKFPSAFILRLERWDMRIDTWTSSLRVNYLQGTKDEQKQDSQCDVSFSHSPWQRCLRVNKVTFVTPERDAQVKVFQTRGSLFDCHCAVGPSISMSAPPEGGTNGW